VSQGRELSLFVCLSVEPRNADDDSQQARELSAAPHVIGIPHTLERASSACEVLFAALHSEAVTAGQGEFEQGLLVGHLQATREAQTFVPRSACAPMMTALLKVSPGDAVYLG